MAQILQIQTVNAPRQIVDGALITPRAWQISVRIPFWSLRLHWSRPLDVLVERTGQPAQRLAIVDTTRIAQIIILLLGITAAAILRRSVK
jgi:hypothetical protein